MRSFTTSTSHELVVAYLLYVVLVQVYAYSLLYRLFFNLLPPLFRSVGFIEILLKRRKLTT